MINSPFMNFVLIIAGAAMFFAIKTLSDFGYRNRALFLRQTHMAGKRPSKSIKKGDLPELIKCRISKNNMTFITKDLPITIDELSQELGYYGPVGLDDEINSILREQDTDLEVEDKIVHDSSSYKVRCSRKLYMHALAEDGYSMQKNIDTLLERNNLASPESIDLEFVKKRGKINTMLLTETQLRKLNKKMLPYCSGNGLLLYRDCSNGLGRFVETDR